MIFLLPVPAQGSRELGEPGGILRKVEDFGGRRILHGIRHRATQGLIFPLSFTLSSSLPSCRSCSRVTEA